VNALQDALRRRFFAGAGIAVFVLTAALSIRLSQGYSDDFHAFYCAGAVVALGADPYRVEPLRTCEHNNGDIHTLALEEGAVLPVALPGYDLVLPALLARLPYGIAALLWQLLLWSCVGTAILCTWRLTNIPLVAVIAVFLFSDGYISSIIGQIAPMAIAGIAFAAWAISRRRHALAVLGTMLGLCEPHIGIASYLALFILYPSVRWGLLAGTGFLGFLTFATIGPVRTLEYFHDVLPAHAASEIAHRGQYSFTSLLHVMGAPDPAALFFGELSYVILIVIGIIAAYRLRRSMQEDAFIIVIPAAFTLLGGAFVHNTQMATALPASLLLYSKYKRSTPVLGWGIILLAVPWSSAPDLEHVQLLVALSIAISSLYFLESTTAAAQATIVQGIALLVSPCIFRAEHVTDAASVSQANFIWKHLAIPAGALSEQAWRLYVSENFSRHSMLFTLFKIPTWLGLSTILWHALSYRDQPRAQSAYSAIR
jgi:hypothetical protein